MEYFLESLFPSAGPSSYEPELHSAGPLVLASGELTIVESTGNSRLAIPTTTHYCSHLRRSRWQVLSSLQSSRQMFLVKSCYKLSRRILLPRYTFLTPPSSIQHACAAGRPCARKIFFAGLPRVVIGRAIYAVSKRPELKLFLAAACLRGKGCHWLTATSRHGEQADVPQKFVEMKNAGRV